MSAERKSLKELADNLQVKKNLSVTITNMAIHMELATGD